MDKGLTVGLLGQLGSLGVLKITLSAEAARAMMESLKGLFVPATDLKPVSEDFCGKLMGVEVYREL